MIRFLQGLESSCGCVVIRFLQGLESSCGCVVIRFLHDWSLLVVVL